MRAYIISAIIKRDLKETYRNPQTLVILGITIGINVFLALAISKPLWIMTFSMCLVMIGFSLTAFMITEEKDKKTLDALLVSPAKYHEILFAKVFLTFFITVSVTLLLIFCFHHTEVSVLHTLLVVPIGAMVICLFGVILGLICQSQAMLSGMGTILMMALFLPELLAPTSDLLGYFARALPTHHVIQIVSLGRDGFSLILFKHYGVLFLSLIVSFFWVVSFIKSAIAQESNVWKYGKSNKLTSFIMLLTLCFSSIVFLPIKGSVVQLADKQFYYQNEEYKISIPYETNKFKLKESRFQNKYLVKFILSTSSENYIYLTVIKNTKKANQKESYKVTLDKIKKLGALNLKTETVAVSSMIHAHRYEYETKNGHYMYYKFSTKKFLFKIGVDGSEGPSKDLSFLTSYLDNHFNGIRIGE